MTVTSAFDAHLLRLLTAVAQDIDTDLALYNFTDADHTAQAILQGLTTLVDRVRNAESPPVPPSTLDDPSNELAFLRSTVQQQSRELQLLRGQIQDAARVCNAVARGDLTQRITATVPAGVESPLTGPVNSMVDQLSAFESQLTSVALGGHEKVESEGVLEGTWANLTMNVNKMASTHTNHIRAIAEVIKAVALGDLSKQLNVDVQGEMLDLKFTVNDMVDMLSALADEITRVSLELGTEGMWGGRVSVPGVQGTWKLLTHNINTMALNLTNQLRCTAHVTNAISSGDFTERMEVFARGEMLELKDDINGMAESLSVFAGEVLLMRL